MGTGFGSISTPEHSKPTSMLRPRANSRYHRLGAPPSAVLEKAAVNATRLQTVAVRLGDVTFQARDPIAIDLRHVGSSLQLGGIFGFDFFRQHVVAIDFHSYRVALYDPVTYRYAGNGVAIPLVIRPPRAYVNVIVAAEGVPPERHSLRLDLGSSDAVDDDIVLRSSAPKQPISGGLGVGQRFPSYLGRVSEIQLGPFKLYDLPAATGGVQLTATRSGIASTSSSIFRGR
jgi:hypothetical protein